MFYIFWISALRFSDEYAPPNPKFGSRPRPVSVPLGPEMHGTQHPDFYMESWVGGREIRLFVVIN